MRRRPVRAIAAVVAAAVWLFVVMIALREPRSDRPWDEEFSRTASAEMTTDGQALIRNVRDFTYGDGTTLSTRWIPEVAVNPKEIVKMWFLLEPFAKMKAIGHTFLSFELADGSAYSFSIEARREKGETYSAFRGLFREYELNYAWGTERDFVTRRLLYLRHPVRMYPLNVSPERAQRLFVSLLGKTNGLTAHPRFYNTFSANCTNMLATVVNQTKPGSVPFDPSWYLPGYSDRFLLRIGLIPMDGTVERTQRDHDLTPERDRVLGVASSPYSEFGRTLRSLLRGG